MSWKEAYRLRAGIVGSNIKSAMQDQTEATAAITAAQLAQAGFRKDIKKSTVPLKQPDKTEDAEINDALDATIKKGGIEGFLASVGKVAETPVIKQGLNVLSTGTYAAANTADNLLDAVNNIGDGNARGISDFLMAPVTGIAQGVNAGIAQNKEDATTFSEVIDHSMDTLNRGKKEGDNGWIDKESDAAKWGKGIGGFIGDVALDPLTYATFGASAAVGGAVRGARQGSKTVKGIAEEAIRKAPENAEVVPPKSTMNFQEIADNPKGRLMTALQESSKDHRSWKTARATAKADKKDIRARRNEAPDGDVTGEFVGINVEAEELAKKARTAEIAAQHTDELERQIEAEVASDSYRAMPNSEQLIEEVKLDVTPEPIKLEETPVKVEEPNVAKTFSEEVKNTVEAAPVALPKPAGIDKNAKIISDLEGGWMRPKYAKHAKELSEPGEATIQRQIPVSQFRENPELAQKYGVDMATLPEDYRRVAVNRAKGTKEFSGGKLEAQANKQKKQEQANTAIGKKNARIKEEGLDWSKAPKQGDDTPFVRDDDSPAVPTHEDIHEFVDIAELENWAASNPGHKLMGSGSGGGAIGTTADKLVDMILGGTSTKLVDNIIENNLFFLGRFANEDQALDIDALADYQNAFDAKMADFQATKAAPTATPDIDETPDDLGELIANFIEVEDANPNVWSPERAAQLGIDPDDGVLSPAEIMALQIPMTTTQIKAKIKGKDKMTKGELDMLRSLTGKTDPKEVADEFIRLRSYYTKELKKKAIPEKVVRQTKEQEVARFAEGQDDVKPIKATEEVIDSVKAESTELAEQFVKSPVAFDEPYQMRLRTANYHMALVDKSHGIPDEELIEIVNEATGSIAKAAINDFGHKAVKDALAVQLKEADFRTNSGMRTATDDKATGGAWSPKLWGSDSQIALHKSIIGSMYTLQKAGKLKPYPAAKRKFFMATLKVADAELRAAGVEPFLNHIDNIPGKASTNISLYDMFAAIDEAGQAKNILDKYVFGRPSESFNMTQLQGAFETVIRLRNTGASEKYIRTRIKSQLTSSQVKHGRPVNNDIAATDATAARLSIMVDKNKSLEDLPAKDAVRTAKRLDAVAADKIADALLDPTAYRAISYRQMINRAAHNSSLGNHVAEYADRMVERLYQVADMIGPGAALRAFNDEAKALKAGLSAEDYAKGKEALDLKLAETVSEVERTNIVTSAKRVELSAPMPTKVLPTIENPHPAKPKANIENAVVKTHVEDAKAVEKEVAETPKPDDVEPFEMRAAEIATAAIKKMHPIQRLTNPRLGLTTDVYRAVNSGMHSIARQQAMFHQTLSMHLEKYSSASLRTDFEELQRLARNGGKGFSIPEEAPDSIRELYAIMNTMLEVSNANVFARNSIGVQHFNTLARNAGLSETWRFDEALSVYDNSHLWANKWEGIGEKGVLDFLSKMHSVAVKASQEIAIGASFSKNFGKTVREPGYVKLVWSNQSKEQKKTSGFYNLIDHDLYYPKDIASQVIQIDKLMRETRSLDTSKPFGKFMVNVFDPVTNALKASQTTVRPGHWTVSIAGDLLRNQLAGVNGIQPYRHAVEIMKASGVDTTDFIGKIESVEVIAKYRKGQEVAQGFTATAGKGVNMFVGGKKVNVSYETFEKILHDVVMLPKHRGGGGVVEDRFIGENTTGKLARGLEKATDMVTDNKHFSLNALAAKRDNFMRISLAVDYASKRKWDSLTDMKNGMEDYITKWAPISTDMTSFESKYARRTMLYYTWLRGITPRIIDSAMTKPGVTTMVPKALYNVAYANGLNPESIGNPFPEDEGLFPSYYYNNILGPQWKDDNGLWGINPSSPVIEVANTFKNITPGDPVGNVLGTGKQLIGMSTPFARMPLELSMGANSTGVPIEDPAQYIGDNLGGAYLSSLSRATGKTINQDGIVNRTDSAYKGDPELQAEHAKLQGINFLTGAKLTDYQSDSAIKSANYEAVEKMKREAEAQMRKQ
jgi:hypothetical protein